MFKQNEKLICVKPGEASLGLIKDKVYTCINFFTSSLGESVVEVSEAMPPNEYHGYLSHRFRKAMPADLEKVKQKETVEI